LHDADVRQYDLGDVKSSNARGVLVGRLIERVEEGVEKGFEVGFDTIEEVLNSFGIRLGTSLLLSVFAVSFYSILRIGGD
jgi:hypothetical protein